MFPKLLLLLSPVAFLVVAAVSADRAARRDELDPRRYFRHYADIASCEKEDAEGYPVSFDVVEYAGEKSVCASGAGGSARYTVKPDGYAYLGKKASSGFHLSVFLLAIVSVAGVFGASFFGVRGWFLSSYDKIMYDMNPAMVFQNYADIDTMDTSRFSYRLKREDGSGKLIEVTCLSDKIGETYGFVPSEIYDLTYLFSIEERNGKAHVVDAWPKGYAARKGVAEWFAPETSVLNVSHYEAPDKGRGIVPPTAKEKGEKSGL